jgi:hypothetical protein
MPLRFETAPELVSGIELTTNGKKWRGASRITSASLERASANSDRRKRVPEAEADP